jgi:hypothetical protein
MRAGHAMNSSILEVSTKLASLKAPIFLARSENRNGKTVVTLHSSEPKLSAGLARDAEKALGTSGGPVLCHVKRHSVRALFRPKSLEALTSRFGHGQIVYDPTRIVSRMTSLVSLARSIRLSLTSKISAIGFESRRRTLYVILDKQAQDRSVDSLRETMARIARVVEGWRNQARPDFDLSVRVGFDAPPASRLVAVDSLSVTTNVMNVLSGKLAQVVRALGIAALFGAGTAVAADVGSGQPAQPAVSQPNLTIIHKGGTTDGELQGDFYAKGTMPLGDLLGVQIEGGIGSDDYYGVAGHLFARDPEFGLLGAYSSFESINNVELSRFAAEAELYLNSVTIGGDLGYQSGEVDEGVFGRVDLKFYASPDFVLSAGGELSPGVELARVGAEWRPGFESLPGISLFADGEFGSDNYDSVRVGFTYHFGSSSSTLIDRDRKEDPGMKLKNEAPVQAKLKKSSGYTPPAP